MLKSNVLLPKQVVLEEKICEVRNVYTLKFQILNKGNIYSKPGQFNMLGIPGFGEAAISFSALVHENSFSHTIKMVGNVTSAICRLNEQSIVQFRGPYGNGWPLDRAFKRDVIIIAGGIGMAPLRPVIYYLLKNRSQFEQIYLFYGSKNEDEILFKNELKNWQRSKDIKVFLSVDEPCESKELDLNAGVVTTILNKIMISLEGAITFTCGPEIMMRFVANHLILNGHNPEDIFVSLERKMKCGVGHCGHCQIGAKYVCQDGPVFSYAEIKKYADTLL